MKYRPNIYDPTNCPPDPRRSYLGTDGRWLVSFPILMMVLVLVAWAGLGTMAGDSRDRAEAVAASRVIADAR